MLENNDFQILIYYIICVKELEIYKIKLWFLFCSTFLDVRHSRDEVAFFRLSLLGGSCLVTNNE